MQSQNWCYTACNKFYVPFFELWNLSQVSQAGSYTLNIHTRAVSYVIIINGNVHNVDIYILDYRITTSVYSIGKQQL